MRDPSDPSARYPAPDGQHDVDTDANLVDRDLRASPLVTLGFGLFGFIIGAVFWHFIGFWGFVSDVVLKGHPDDARAVAQTGHDCVEMALDRETGRISAIRCPLFAPELAESRRGREDSVRLAVKKDGRVRWSTLVSQDEDDRPPAER